MKKVLLSGFFLFFLAVLQSQDYFPTNVGTSSPNENYTAFLNATIHSNPDETLEGATLLIQGNKIIGVGKNISLPKGCLTIEAKGMHIYPSFIDLYSDFGVEQPTNAQNRRGSQYDATRQGYYWNDHIRPETDALAYFKYDNTKAEELLKLGFGVVNTHRKDGIMRGTSILVALNNAEGDAARILDQRSASHLSFEKSKESPQNYPTSLMGAMALIRQVYYDAEWYAAGNSETKDLSLEAALTNKSLPQIFDAGNMLNDLRADKIADEFGIRYIIKGGGDEYSDIQSIKETKASFIIPIAFPEAYDVSDPLMVSALELKDMRYWNQAPINPKILVENKIPIALTAADLKKLSDFKQNLSRAIEYGLSERDALAALTTTPASLLGKSEWLGTLKKGAYANFIISSGPLFNKTSIWYENWVQGKKYIITDKDIRNLKGSYELNVNGSIYQLTFKGEEATKPTIELKKDTLKLESKVEYKKGWITIFFKETNGDGFTRLSGYVGNEARLGGNGTAALGNEVSWFALPKQEEEKVNNENKKDESTPPKVMPVTFPNTAYGFLEKPKAQNLLFRNATVWTNESDGVLKNTDVLVKNGKIAAIGSDLNPGDARIIDASGKHLTAGIIDEHSHIAAAAINEAGHNSSAEVTIEDVVMPDDIDIYRNLSGGVTSIQILHGSANPIGGRSAIIKLKWGSPAKEMIYKDSPKFIKFALGENVKQSNWGEVPGQRFPQTRMGVEQVFIDYFNRAKAYETQWNAYNKISSKDRAKAQRPRYDLEMETLVEILNSKRYISCHSYVQSEINMLMKVADKFDFRVNTFTHILEGYKVADKMAQHGVAGSSFSDWWGYKFEVKDAIPYNGAIMHNAGVLVAFNSDDAEMSRRLNQEAAKAVKYGGVSEEDAWKFVTLNPAKMLHLDQRVGSIKVGKDADLVLWTGHPMSIYSQADKTLIEGIIYYDKDVLPSQLEAIKREKNELTNMMLEAKNKGMETKSPSKKNKELLHCDSEIYQQ